MIAHKTLADETANLLRRKALSIFDIKTNQR